MTSVFIIKIPTPFIGGLSKGVLHDWLTMKTRWQVIMPKRGALNPLIQHVHKHFHDCIDVVITRSQLELLEKVHSYLTSLNVGSDLEYRFHKFQPRSYQTILTVPLPYTRQLERPERCGDPSKNLKYGTESTFVYIDKEHFKPRSAKRNAKDTICREVLISYLGETAHAEAIKNFDSNSSMLFAYCHRLGLPMPGIVTHCVQAVKPVKYTGLVCSHMVSEPGQLKLKGEIKDTYGSALESVFTSFNTILTALRLQQQLNFSPRNNTLTEGSAV